MYHMSVVSVCISVYVYLYSQLYLFGYYKKLTTVVLQKQYNAVPENLSAFRILTQLQTAETCVVFSNILDKETVVGFELERHYYFHSLDKKKTYSDAFPLDDKLRESAPINSIKYFTEIIYSIQPSYSVYMVSCT